MITTASIKRVAVAALAIGVIAGARADGVLTELPRTPDGRPDLSGIWQALDTAHWNLEPHASDYPVPQAHKGKKTPQKQNKAPLSAEQLARRGRVGQVNTCALRWPLPGG